MSARTSVLSLSVAILVSASLPVQAQALYRCGNTYQDKPCPDGKKIAGISPGSKDALPKEAPLTPACQSRGEAAQKLVWAREGGMSEAQMLVRARTEEEKKLVRDVYQMRGTSNTIKTAIGNQCMDEQKREMSPPAAAAGPASAPASAAAAASAASADAEKKKHCAQLRSSLEALQKQTGATNRAGLDNELKKAGC